MTKYTVYLFRSPECIRGWLSYLRKEGKPCTVVVEVEAETGAKAKNKAITLANQRFEGLKIVDIPRSDSSIWDIGNFPELNYLLKNE